jgi:hypothetical protein
LLSLRTVSFFPFPFPFSFFLFLFFGEWEWMRSLCRCALATFDSWAFVQMVWNAFLGSHWFLFALFFAFLRWIAEPLHRFLLSFSFLFLFLFFFFFWGMGIDAVPVPLCLGGFRQLGLCTTGLQRFSLTALVLACFIFYFFFPSPFSVMKLSNMLELFCFSLTALVTRFSGEGLSLGESGNSHFGSHSHFVWRALPWGEWIISALLGYPPGGGSRLLGLGASFRIRV